MPCALVVDDHFHNVKLLEAQLMIASFDVMTALSGEEALSKLEERKPDIILLDIMMPNMDGFEVCRRVRANPETADIPVVMVTALDKQIDRVMASDVGADEFFTKPVEDHLLMQAIRLLIKKKDAPSAAAS
ncbi:MAG TPA: response regulator [Caulobacteraceae bacterium]|jgi:two-component system cell cycle response regulator